MACGGSKIWRGKDREKRGCREKSKRAAFRGGNAYIKKRNQLHSVKKINVTPKIIVGDISMRINYRY